MIWIVGMALAAVFVKLGMLIVMVKLLSIGLALMMIVGGVLAIALFWKYGVGLVQRLFHTSTA
ncbi:MAG: hypothetical protein POELPBGB_03994 [Bacteroidia bacterium]|nr:hypothetical protein [Bacteroidia bacterium]